MAKKYIDESGLSAVFKKIKALIATKANATHIHDAATQSAAGFLSATDKKKLDGVADGATKITVDTGLSSESTNPVQNKVINSALAGKAASNHGHSYNDLTDKPTIPSYSDATQSAAGLMSADDKKKVDGLDPITTAGDGAAYTASVPHITALTAGVSFVMVPHTVSTSTTATLNVNGLGAKQIRRRLTNMATSLEAGYSASWLASGKPFRVKYDGTYWVVEDMPKPAAADLYGTLGVAKGGTGKTSVTAGNFLVGNGTSAMTEKTPAEVLTALGLTTETWTFTLEDGSTVTKAVYVG